MKHRVLAVLSMKSNTIELNRTALPQDSELDLKDEQ